MPEDSFDKIKEDYKDAVNEVSEHPTIFVDTQKISDLPSDQAAEEFTQQVDRQVPGSSDVILGDYSEAEKDISVAVRSAKGPSAEGDFIVNGEEHCLVNIPDNDFMHKSDILIRMGHGLLDENDIQNFPGSTSDLLKSIGYHEAGHCNEDHYMDKVTEKISDIEDAGLTDEQISSINFEDFYRMILLQDEANQDNLVLQHSSEEIALAYKDIRALGSYAAKDNPDLLVPGDITHATNIFLNEEKGTVTPLHYEAAKGFKDKMETLVESKIDFKNYEGDAKNPAELLEENPDLYFKLLNKALDEENAELLEKYKNDPSYDNTKDIISQQASNDYISDFEDAYRRRKLGEDIPERDPKQLIPLEAEKEFLDQYNKTENILTVDQWENTDEIQGVQNFLDEEITFKGGDVYAFTDQSNNSVIQPIENNNTSPTLKI